MPLAQAKDGVLLRTKIAALHRKWDDICQRLHHSQPSPKANNYQLDSQVPSVVGFQDGNINFRMDSSETGSKNVDSREEENFAKSKASSPSSFLSNGSSLNFLSKFDETPSKAREKDRVGSPSSSNAGDDLTSPTSATSTTLDLNLEVNTACRSSEMEKPQARNRLDIVQDFSFCSSRTTEVVSGSDSSNQAKSSCSHPHIEEQFDQKDFKMLYATLAERIGRQEEAIKVVSQTLARCRMTNERPSRANRRDIWFYFLGPDRLGKKALAVALAEVLYGSRENLIHVDLGFQDEVNHSNTTFDHQCWNSHDVRHRGKNVVDYIAEKLSKKPLSVVLLEGINKADLLVQNSLLQAVKAGRLQDSHGREISICNAIFVITSRFISGEQILDSEAADYSEGDILAAKGCAVQMMIGFDLCDDFTNTSSSLLDTKMKGNLNRIIMNKRKLIGNNDTTGQCNNSEAAKRKHRASNAELDLNFPAEESETCDICPGNSDSDSLCDNSRAWLEHFSEQMDATVVFQPYDFDGVAQKILQDISECFRKIISSECSLEIDSNVMMQVIAAAYLINTKRVEDWIHCVLGRGFEEAQQKYSLTARSTVKLVACCEEGTLQKWSTPAEFLPPKIILN